MIQIKDSRIPGVQDSSVMLRNYKELNVFQNGTREEIGDVERMVKAMIRSLENEHLNP